MRQCENEICENLTTREYCPVCTSFRYMCVWFRRKFRFDKSMHKARYCEKKDQYLIGMDNCSQCRYFDSIINYKDQWSDNGEDK